MKKFTKALALISATALMVGTLSACSSGDSESKGEVRVYNWGDYIDPTVVDLFEEETGIEVIYDMYETNEDMYLKLSNSSGYTYDIAIPSDYMIDRMIEEDMLAEINLENVPNAAGIDEKFLGLSYDPDDKYTIPYMWGTVCIAYDPAQVTEPVTSWDILWDEKYSGNMFMIDSERDSIGVALLKLGHSINTRDTAELEAAKQELLTQKPLVLDYTGDDIKDKLISREGAMGVIWSCDIGIILEEDTTLAYAIPEEGTNLWFDAAVILKNSENKENAEAFLNFLCRPDIAQLNADYLGSASPVIEALNNQDESIRNNPVVNPSAEAIAKYEVFENMTDVASEYEKIWSDVLAS